MRSRLTEDPERTTRFFELHHAQFEHLLTPRPMRDAKIALAKAARSYFNYSESTASTDILRHLKRKFKQWRDHASPPWPQT